MPILLGVFLILSVQAEPEPRTLEEWMERGRERFVNGFTKESVSAWTRAIEKDPAKVEGYLGRAAARRQSGDSAGAGEDLKKALQLAPDSPDALVEHGITAERRGSLAVAKEDYDRALSIDPGHVGALLNRGWLRRRQNRHKEAVEDFSRAAEAKSNDRRVITSRAYAKMALGNLDPQEEKGAGGEEAVQGILTGGTIEWVKGALDDLNFLVERDPKNGSLAANRASVHISLGNFTEAEQDLQRSIGLAPGFSGTHFELGRLLEYTGRFKEALASFSRAVELDPKLSRGYFGRANMKGRLGDDKGAIADLNKVIELSGKWTSAYFNRAMARNRLKDHAGAAADFNKVIELDDGKLVMAALCNRAWCKQTLGDPGAAKKDYAKAAGMAAETPWQLRYRAMAKENIADLKGAVADMQQALDKSAAGSSERAEIEKDLVRLRAKK